MTRLKGRFFEDSTIESTKLVSVGSNIKVMVAGEAFDVGVPLSKRPDGRVVRADSDGIDRQNFCGTAKDASLGVDDEVRVTLIGPNVSGALSSYLFVPGEEIYMGENPGSYVNTAAAFSGENDSIVRLGIADCAEGVASVIATDLILFPEVIARPSLV